MANIIRAGSGALKPKLLWENASPSSSFVAQTLDLDGSWRGYMIEIVDNANHYDSPICRTICYVRSHDRFAYAEGRASTRTTQIVVERFCRRVTEVDENSIRFAGVGVIPGWATEESAGYCVPMRIWGVKWNLVEVIP